MFGEDKQYCESKEYTLATEFPNVVVLHVGGTHTYTVQLSTLTKHVGSQLAEMFSGHLPVYKDKNGFFFIEGDGNLFRIILDYLQYGELPKQQSRQGLFGSQGKVLSSEDARKLYRESLRFGLKKLSNYLEHFQPNFIDKKLQEFKDSINNYQNIITEILSSITAELLLQRNEVSVRLFHDLQQVKCSQCCKHECNEYSVQFSRAGNKCISKIDAVVNIHSQISPLFITCIVADLCQLGFDVTAAQSMCVFKCNKKTASVGFFSGFGHPIYHCCREVMDVLRFTWHHDFLSTNVFGMPQQCQPLIFGEAPLMQQNTGFTFGSLSGVDNQPQQPGVLNFSGTTAFGQSENVNNASSCLQQCSSEQKSNVFSFGSSTQTGGYDLYKNSFGQPSNSQKQTTFGTPSNTGASNIFSGVSFSQPSNQSQVCNNTTGGFTWPQYSFGQSPASSKQSLFGNMSNIETNKLFASNTFGQVSKESPFGTSTFVDSSSLVGSLPFSFGKVSCSVGQSSGNSLLKPIISPSKLTFSFNDQKIQPAAPLFPTKPGTDQSTSLSGFAKNTEDRHEEDNEGTLTH